MCANKSALVDYELCRKCGNCCRSLRFWIAADGELGARIQALTQVGDVVERVACMGDAEMLEIKTKCCHFDEDSGACRVFGETIRPALCNEFPDNLFNRNEDGKLILDDEHAMYMIDLYEDYCPGVKQAAPQKDAALFLLRTNATD